jgi:hypothetical protein
MIMTYATVTHLHANQNGTKGSTFLQAFKSFMEAWCEKSRLYGVL